MCGVRGYQTANDACAVQRGPSQCAVRDPARNNNLDCTSVHVSSVCGVVDSHGWQHDQCDLQGDGTELAVREPPKRAFELQCPQNPVSVRSQGLQGCQHERAGVQAIDSKLAVIEHPKRAFELHFTLLPVRVLFRGMGSCWLCCAEG